MPTVPLAKRTVDPRPILQQGFTSRASGEDFGSQVGRAAQNVAQGIGEVGDAYAQVRELKDRSAAKQAFNGLMGNARNFLNDPEIGYLNSMGQNAVDGRGAAENGLRELRAQAASSLTPSQRKYFDEMADNLDNSNMENVIQHAGREQKRQIIEDSEATANNLLDQALSSPAQADKFLAQGLGEIKERAHLQGWTPAMLDSEQRSYLSKATKMQALQLANSGAGGALKAQEFVERNAARLSAADKITLDDALKAPALAAKAQRNLGLFTSGAPSGREPQGPVQDGRLRIDENGQAVWGGTGTTGRVSDKSNIPGAIGAVINNAMGLNESADASAISRFIKGATGISINPRVTPWCAGFVNAVLATQGIEGTGQLNARSFLNFGMATDNPQPGDIVVFKRPGAGKGHVGFFNGFDSNGNIKVVGGNQSDSVKESTYSKDDLLGFRTAGNVNEHTAMQPNYTPQGLGYLYDKLEGIADPEEREATRKAIDAHYTQEKKLLDAQQEQVQRWAQEQVIRNPTMNLSAIPVEMQTAIGTSGMKTLMDYQEKVRTQGQPTTDDRVLYDLQTKFAENPAAFAQVDLFQYRAKLSNADWDTVNGWRQSAIQDSSKAARDGRIYSDAFSQAQQSLASAGLVTTGIKGDDSTGRANMEARIGRFQAEMKTRIDAFATDNKRQPTYDERQAMINELLLPIVIQRPGKLWGTNDETGRFLFESPNRDDGTAFEIRVPYADIPFDLRAHISGVLATQLGRQPKPEEIEAEYSQMITGSR